MYGLLGKKLKHSFSKEVHEMLGNNQYQLIETNDLESFFSNHDIQGINVTIPYKEKVIPFLDKLDELAMKIGAVNTIVKRDEKLIGYNTDYIGLKEMITHYNIPIASKKVLIVGNGGAAKTCKVLFEDLNATQIKKICRQPRLDDEIPFKSIDSVLDYDIIVNTTPIGMYPNNDDACPISIDDFTHCIAVIDLIYNPANTKLLLSAKDSGISTYNGLYMLVMQAISAHELFHNVSVSEEYRIKIYSEIKRSTSNLVLVGMPLSGKSKYAILLSSKYAKELIDTDESIEDMTQKKISDIFEEQGESSFRKMESDLVESTYKSLNMAISTGGGMIENHPLMMKLKQNGVVIFLNKDPMKIASLTIRNRPLIKSSSDVLNLAKRRIPLYEKYADIIVNIDKDTSFHINEIEEKLNEYFSR
ncbi:MAG: shikimate dehydrogenase [Firmicutes bacterium]|nr:shikimate dehydrogenase [Bacillota bacterium]